MHCSPQMLHFHGLLSLWHPLCRKYRVWSGNSMPQNRHWRFCFPFCPFSRAGRVSSFSGPVDVIAPFEVVATADSVEFDDDIEDIVAESVEATADSKLCECRMPDELEFDVCVRLFDIDGDVGGIVFRFSELLLFRRFRVVARADIRRFRSSRSRDFSGETCERIDRERGVWFTWLGEK